MRHLFSQQVQNPRAKEAYRLLLRLHGMQRALHHCCQRSGIKNNALFDVCLVW